MKLVRINNQLINLDQIIRAQWCPAHDFEAFDGAKPELVPSSLTLYFAVPVGDSSGMTEPHAVTLHGTEAEDVFAYLDGQADDAAGGAVLGGEELARAGKVVDAWRREAQRQPRGRARRLVGLVA